MADRSSENARHRAEERFAASERRDVTIKQEIAKEAQRISAKTAKLRALRLAKEASDREAEAAAAPSSSPAKAKAAAAPKAKKFRF